ncbi:BamA/OMP85 family outer membrane protein [Aporhodopirellula aestuarii]|uniref:BamA/TamA family outer membrane protein n=1 Tax=Aporhodopirellula aestuarii TaxID=2950107 RepID=A0ABT0UCL6_9BACT|nr:BamA/TamA family outer membrane protein [Aporhodopirellula aestuarii]MCM2374552.1 BamA/TamA family outer membrane protein [Aporhodopirellula aestuarii]
MIDVMNFQTKKTTVKRAVGLLTALHVSAATLLAPVLAFAQQPYSPPSAYSVPQPAPQYGGSTYGTNTPPSFSTPGYGTAPQTSAPASPNAYGGDVYSQPPAFNPTYNDPPVNYPPVAPYPPMVTGPEVREADLIIQGYPARTGRVMFGGAVNSDAGVTGQVTIDERNFDISRWPTSFQDLFSGTAFRGAGQTFRLEAVPGSVYQRYTAQFADPNLFGYLPISMSISGFYYDRQFDDWDEGRLGGRLSFGYRITPDLSISAGVNGQNVEISQAADPSLPQLAEVLGDNALYSGMFSLIHDTRNSPLQPSEGHYIKASYEQAFGDFDYGRFEGEYRKYWLMRERADGSGKQTLSFGSQIGISGEDTPIFENFFAGGYATIRGFDFRGASPVVSTGAGLIEVGGRFQWLNSVEYMFPLTADDAFRGVAFVDFGTVEEDIEINEDNFRVAPGFGFRVAIPMLGPAPLAFDFAFPVMKAEFDDERMFSFYMSTTR